MRIISLFFILLILSNLIWAQDLSQRVESHYFTIYYSPYLDPLDLAYKINIGSPIIVYKSENIEIVTGSDPDEILADQIDILFNEVSDILDMHLYSYHGDIKIYPTQQELNSVLKDICEEDGEVKSFYSREQNIIYISAQDFTPSILGHEMAHAIISRYFVVLPPMKIQEVLAQFVEYNIRKKFQK
jgi:hypothetical protein